ncbi:MAG: polyphosphate kinase 2 family protein, partial [Clostridia bacterium]
MILSSLDLTKKLEHKEYEEELKEYQLKLLRLQRKLFEKEIPLILVFEGWDASGKGGAIKRVTESLDPRGFQVHPIAAPSQDELQHHYMWRFWQQFPKKGGIGIFDRSWYGRVLVERVEGFAKPEEWQRAYDEINHTEKMLNDDGAYILKFWLHISAEEQLKRFKERENNPLKKWKITKEDWRNREKREDYEAAVEEMIRKTHSPFAPWHLIEAENKKYARVKVLKTI